MTEALYIDGCWRPATAGGTLDVINPASECVFATVAAATASDVDLAVKAARRAFDDGPWRRLTGGERATVLRSIADAIRGERDALAAVEVEDNGKPLPEALWDIDDAAACFTFYADLAAASDATPPEQLRLGDVRFSSTVVSEPVGVVAAIVPWNYPLLMAAWKVAPALAAGCTVVLKPSEWSPMTALRLAAITHEVGLPAGVLNVVTGFGPEAGQSLADHPLVDKLAFTGSIATGSKIMTAAARDIKRVSLELEASRPFWSSPTATSTRPSSGSCSVSSGTRGRSVRRHRACWSNAASTNPCSSALPQPRNGSWSATAA